MHSPDNHSPDTSHLSLPCYTRSARLSARAASLRDNFPAATFFCHRAWAFMSHRGRGLAACISGPSIMQPHFTIRRLNVKRGFEHWMERAGEKDFANRLRRKASGQLLRHAQMNKGFGIHLFRPLRSVATGRLPAPGLAQNQRSHLSNSKMRGRKCRKSSWFPQVVMALKA
jgi:hypothetical protein